MLPNPEIQPLLRPEDIVGLHPKLRRTAVYDAIKRGDLPSMKVGARIYIPTAELRRMLFLDDAGRDSVAPSRPTGGDVPDQGEAQSLVGTLSSSPGTTASV